MPDPGADARRSQRRPKRHWSRNDSRRSASAHRREFAATRDPAIAVGRSAPSMSLQMTQTRSTRSAQTHSVVNRSFLTLRFRSPRMATIEKRSLLHLLPEFFLRFCACANSPATHTFRIAKIFLLRCVQTLACARTPCTRTQPACPCHVCKNFRKNSRDVRESDSASDHASAALSSSGKMRCIAGLRHAAGCTIEPAQTSPSVVVIDTPFGIASPDADDAVTDQLEEILQSRFFSWSEVPFWYADSVPRHPRMRSRLDWNVPSP
jgi:hypothetical protein